MPPADRRREFCSLVRQCGLPAVDAPFCPDELTHGAPGVTYDEDRCQQPRDVAARGLKPWDPLGYPVYRFLGRRYRVAYALSGRVPVSAARLSYLIDELPFACRLVTYFQKTAYEAEYLDAAHRRFRARKGDALKGEVELAAGGVSQRTLFYLGRGSSKVGPWSFAGQGFLRFEFSPAPSLPSSIDYRVTLVASPDNGFINTIMNMGMFKGIVNRHLRETVTDLTEAARKLQEAPAELPGTWSAEDRERMKALRALP
jgi:hypothetical protein